MARFSTFACALTTVSIVALATPAEAQERQYNIPAGPLGQALDAWGSQSGQQVIYKSDEVSSARSRGAKGTLSAEAALNTVLSGSGFELRKDASGAFAVVKVGNASAADSAASLGDIIVTGTNIRGARNTAPPIITLTRKDIDRAGYTSTEELFEKLPQNFNEVSDDAGFAPGGSELAANNFRDRVSGVNLRGLGAQSTLTLINGHRRAGSVDGRVIDISTIPLSVIDRVDVVTGGNSAIYGADAVAGVVNIVTRRRLDGAITELTSGVGENGGGRLGFSQTVGLNSGNGHMVAAYDFSKEYNLDLVETGAIANPDPRNGRTITAFDLTPESRRHSAYLAGELALSDRATLYGDGLYSWNHYDSFSANRRPGALLDSTTDVHHSSRQYGITVGARVDVGQAWKIDLSAGRSAVRNKWGELNELNFPPPRLVVYDSIFERNVARLQTYTGIASGPLPAVFGIEPSVAVGVEFRKESYRSVNDVTGVTLLDKDRDIQSIFAELSLPIVRKSEAAGLRSLNLDLAARYDHYSDFGETFNPQAGLVWEVLNGFRIRSAYSRAFRAPALFELGQSNPVGLSNLADPANGGTFSPVLQWTGGNPDLGPEQARTWSAGVDLEPVPGVALSANYFHVNYRGRLDVPAGRASFPFALQREEFFTAQINRQPTAAEIAAILATDSDGVFPDQTGSNWIPDPSLQDFGILAAFPGLVIFDNRTGNIASEKLRGLDFDAKAKVPTKNGDFSFGVNASYTLKHSRRVTVSSPSFSLINEVGKPADFRFRAQAGWSNDTLGLFVFLNHVDGYSNPFSTVQDSVDAWNTVDLNLQFNTKSIIAAGAFRNVNLGLSISNLFDAKPPVALLNGPFRYDAMNANPIGRYFSLRLRKSY